MFSPNAFRNKIVQNAGFCTLKKSKNEIYMVTYLYDQLGLAL